MAKSMQIRVSLKEFHMKTFSLLSWVLLAMSLLILFILNLSLGSVNIPFGEIVNILAGKNSAEPSWAAIVWDFRMTKALTCVLVGGALSISGLQLQTLFRNALVGPDVLGLSSGASLAVSIVLLSQSAGLSIIGSTNAWTVVIASTIGCLGVFLIMLSVSFRLRDNISLLLVGLMVGAGTASIVSVLQYLSKAEDLQVFMIWTFGSLGSLDWAEIRIITGILVVGGAIAIASVKSLNAWLLGESYARTMGINVRRSRLMIILSTSILTGSITAFCGPIAFVGLAVPHLVKLIVKTNDHKILIPAVLLAGAALVLFCDILAQLPGSTQVLPINAITALIGAPIVIWVIMRNKKISI
jgi:iron complex transport system permease protein